MYELNINEVKAMQEWTLTNEKGIHASIIYNGVYDMFDTWYWKDETILDMEQMVSPGYNPGRAVMIMQKRGFKFN